MNTYQLEGGAAVAAFWACRDSAHQQVHHLAKDHPDYPAVTMNNLLTELAWTLDAAAALLPGFDLVDALPGRCWTRPEAEGGILLCDHPLDPDTILRVVNAARASLTDEPKAVAS